MTKITTSRLATGMVLALFVVSFAAVPVFAQSTSTSTYVTFKVVNGHGVPVASVKSILEVQDHRYIAYTNSFGIVSFNLAGYPLTARLQADFEKGTRGASLLSTVGQVIGQTVTITLH